MNKNIPEYINDECSICLDHIGYNNQDYIILPNCLHKYHYNCLYNWERINTRCNGYKCPLCNNIYKNYILIKNKTLLNNKSDIKKKTQLCKCIIS
jgi:hypothetical protein